MTHTVLRFDEPAAFLAAAGPFLEKHEAENNLLLGVAGRLAEGGGEDAQDSEPAFWLVEDGGAAMSTPPYDLVLGVCADGAVPLALAHAIADDGRSLPGAHGPTGHADALAEVFCERSGLTPTLFRAERIYRCTEVAAPTGVPGVLREAGHDELELLAAWYTAFAAETDEPPPTAVDGEGAFVWDDGGPVSLAASRRRTRKGAAIGPVYTPPEHRGHGYGSAVTAALTQHLLDSGLAFACLYTDLGNDVSNRIYRRIGYRPVLDVSHYRFKSSV